MTITTSVDATWRVGRVEIDTPHDHRSGGTVRGNGEVLIAEPGGTSLFGTGKAYGAIPGDSVTRNNEDVMDATVEVAGGTSISWRTILEALPLFVEKWRTEDIQNPPARMIPQKGEAPTNVPDYRGLPITGPDQLPPPKPT